MTSLQSSWKRCWNALEASGNGLALMQDLITAYEEPQRKYHTIQHLTECVALLEQNLDLAAEQGEVEIALWFHDAVYNVRASDNEARSAEWAAAALEKASVAPDRIERVKQHIMATRHSAKPTGQDQMLVVDIDLSILGAPEPRFAEYEAQVRAEYRWVPEFLFRSKRKSILAEFGARDSIYNTPRLREQLEARARENLAYSLKQLGS
ncbi:MAG TPA: hypothetical protein VJS64_12110 [Pyrinomonadaceae bacterium]|nr:hypothetical protein [Pyrinomonadaceae bacterium]